MNAFLTRKHTYSFMLFDTNGDGLVERADHDRIVEAACKARGLSGDAAAKFHEGMAQIWVTLEAMVDRDGDHKINLDEWLAFQGGLASNQGMWQAAIEGNIRQLVARGEPPAAGHDRPHPPRPPPGHRGGAPQGPPEPLSLRFSTPDLGHSPHHRHHPGSHRHAVCPRLAAPRSAPGARGRVGDGARRLVPSSPLLRRGRPASGRAGSFLAAPPH